MKSLFSIFKREKEKSIEVLDKRAIEKEAESLPKEIESGEPNWYHYVIVILVFLAVFGLIYVGFELYDKLNSDPTSFTNVSEKYKYPYTVGNVTYNIYFNTRPENLLELNFTLEPSKLDILNTRELIFSFDEYNGSDNGKISVASSKLLSFFQRVYVFTFDPDVNFKLYNESNCSTSTMKNKVVLFEPYSNVNGVFFNESNGCIEIKSTNIDEMMVVVDSLIFKLINQ